jgi:hypothetical protein
MRLPCGNKSQHSSGVLLLFKVAVSNADVEKYATKFLITELHVWLSAMFRNLS